MGVCGVGHGYDISISGPGLAPCKIGSDVLLVIFGIDRRIDSTVAKS